MRKIVLSIILLVSFLNLIGCSTKANDLNQAMNEVGKTDSNDKDSKIVYGPYYGTEIFRITMSKVDASFSEALNKKEINGLEMDYKTIHDRIYISTRYKEVSYAYEAKISNRYSGQRHFDLFYEAMNSSNL